MTEAQSPQVSGSVTSSAQLGQYSGPGPGSGGGFCGRVAMKRKTVAQKQYASHYNRPDGPRSKGDGFPCFLRAAS